MYKFNPISGKLDYFEKSSTQAVSGFFWYIIPSGSNIIIQQNQFYSTSVLRVEGSLNIKGALVIK